jgi:2,3-bisphosphoglycerate-independent phosphoglycerate mutase
LKRPKPICLIILDGFGIAPPGQANAIYLAKTPNFDYFYRHFPNSQLAASGEDVGLPSGQMGNSEVGHLNIGAGRIVYQELTRISRAVDNGSFFQNPALTKAVEHAKSHRGVIHFLGLLSDGGVHSHNTHLYALLKLAKRHDLKQAYIHAFLDGRDVPPRSSLKYINELESKIKKISVGKIATISGRYYAMDRDRRWQRTKLAYDALVHGVGQEANSARQAVENSYKEDITDEFVKPTVIKSNGDENSNIMNGDAAVFFNLRSDRARQLTQALTDRNFQQFDRGKPVENLFFVCLTEYDIRFNLPVAFPPEDIVNNFAEVVSQQGLRQLHTAETEKYAHVTFFFNSGVEKPKPGEDRVLIDSPKVATYDLQPEMSAPQVAQVVISKLKKKLYDVIIMNFANCDMVGHTGSLPATIKAVETIDTLVGQITRAVVEAGGECLIIADHGNAERMIDEQGKPWTAHTNNPVPIIYIGQQNNKKISSDGRLADVAPTLLSLLGIDKPREMTGKNLLFSPG